MQRKCKMSLKLQKQKIIEKLKKYDSSVDWEQTIDWDAELDSSLHFNENLNKICEKLGINPDLFDIDKGEIEHYENQELQREQKHYDRLFKKELKKIVKETPNIDRFYSKLYGYLDVLLKSKDINGLIVVGGTGLGKSYQVIKYLEKNKINYNTITCWSSPLELYQQLYDMRDLDVIVIDDLMKVLDNEATKGILLASLWSVGEKRWVEWKTTSQKLKVPNKFPLRAKIILICNELPSNIENVLSRVLFYELRFDYKDRIKLIYEICKYKGIPLEIAEFIEKHTDETTKEEFLNLRTPIKFYEIYKNNKENWKTLCLEQLKFDENLKIVFELLQKDITEKARVQEFIERTGKSRRTYFRYKKKLMSSDTDDTKI